MEMDKRIALLPDEILDFPGLTCHIISEIGRGSNALVYRAWYADHHHADEHHEVLIKELFPVHPNGGIYRAADRSIVCTPEGEKTYALHRESFEAGNSVHLALLRKQPDGVGANLNTYALNGTLYTVLGFNGGRSLSEEFTGLTISLRPLVERMIKLLNELEGFHENGLLHLDIAPDNIMLLGKGNRERMMLIDFNSCQYIEAAVDSASVFSAKPGYTAPEILIRRYDRIGPWTDLYSVAAILYRAITGQELTTSQMLRRQPPDVGDCPCMIDMPDSVHSLMQAILRKGLHELARKRYASVREMREDLSELLDRIDGVGITHSALWEAGRRNVMRTVRGNPSMTFIRDDDRLYPSNAKVDGETAPVGEQLNQLMAKRENALLIAGGGMGKTTAMLRSALECTKSYSGNRPAVAYLSLYGWQPGERNYILNRVLETLRFKPETRSFEDARKALLELLERPLSTPQGQRPVLLLMLDGLNETISERQPLIEEIMQLSGMQGVGIVVATRTDESALPFRKLELAALEESDVNAVLAEAGLLLPESPEMRLLLRTPLMLSIYVQSSLAEQKQLNVRTQGDLMSAYFAALKEKELSSAPENAEGRWQIEAALDYVLPSLASELHRRNRALEDARLLPVVENCWKLFHSRLMRRAFPQWIGHSAAIRGEAKSAEEWYGRIVHELLWKRLGMLLRDEQGRYQIAHQIIEEYLLNKDRDNRKQIERRRWVKTALILTTITIVLLGGYFIYDSCFRPKPLVPYSEKLADNVMERAASAYVAAGNQYERLKKLTEYAARSPDRFEEAWERYEGGTSVAALPMDYSEKLLKDLLASGEVMPWSGKPMDTENALALLRLYGERKEVYEEYAALLRFVLTDEQAERHYASEYPARLLELLEVDADINATLYQIVCEPHVTGKYADGSTTEKNYDSLMEDVTEQNKHLSDTTDIDVLKRNMDILYGLREKCKGEIDASGAKAMYLRKRRKHVKTNKGIRLLAMVMAALLLSVPAIAETGAVSDTGAVKDKLLSDFFDYLYAQEKIYSDVLWAEAYLEQYDQARSWDRLQIARAAANTAWRDIAGRELPEPGMSADDYYNLLLIGVDASFMEVSAEEYQSSRTLMQNIVMGMRYHLEDHVFESHGWESSVQHAKLVRECAEDHLRYCANTADWLLLELEDPARAEHFRAFLEENCPAIASRRTSDLADQAALEEATEQVLTRIENMIGSLAELTGQMNANLYLYEDAIASGDVSQGIGETIPIAGLPLTLPYPWWEEKFSAQRITYYWNDAEGSMRLASTGDVLDAAPDGCVMETTGVSREDLESYKDYLESLGIVSLSSKEEDGGLTVYYSLGGSEFAFSWTEEALTLYMFEKPVCFAPVWYIAAQ